MTIETLIELLKKWNLTTVAAIEPQSRLKEDLYFTSFTSMLLIIHLEQYFNTELEIGSLSNISTIEELYQLTQQLNGRSNLK